MHYESESASRGEEPHTLQLHPADQVPWYRRTHFVVPAMVLVMGIGLSVAVSRSAHTESQRSAEERFQATAVGATLQVERRFGAYVEVLSGMRALFNTGEVSREEFHRYAAALDLKRNFPGFQVLNYAPYVPPNGRAPFEAAVRADPALPGHIRFSILPPGERDGYHPLTYIEPLQGNEQVLGKDMGALPPVRLALERARDTGEINSSGKIIQVRGPNSEIGLAVRMPVYRPGLPTETLDQRRAAYVGSVGAGFHVTEMLSGLTGPQPDADAGLRLRLYDGGPLTADGISAPEMAPRAQPDHLLFDTAPRAQLADESAPAEFTTLRAFRFAGRQWVVEVSAPLERFASPQDRMLPLIILLGGLTITALLAGVLGALMTSQRRAVGLAREMTRSLRTSERRLEEAQGLAKMGSWVLDPLTGRMDLSAEARRIYGLAPDAPTPQVTELIARVPDPQRQEVREAIERVGSRGAPTEVEHALQLDDGSQRWVHMNLRRVNDRGVASVQGTVRDETSRKRAALRLELAHSIARELAGEGEVEAAIDFVLSHTARQLGWEAAACWVPSTEGDAGVQGLVVWSTGDDADLVGFVRELRAWRGPVQGTSVAAAWASGTTLWRAVSASAAGAHAHDAIAQQAGFQTALTVPVLAQQPMAALEFFSRSPVSVDRDVMGFMQSVASQLAQYLQRKQAERAMRHLATHDTLTGLANRALLQERLEQAIHRARRHHRRLAVLFIDLDRFKYINDSLGHTAGDMLLTHCAHRLTACLRDIDTVARFGGDEFVVILEDLVESSDAIGPIAKMLGQCSEPFEILGRELTTTASIGVSVFPDDGADAETLLMNADAAMYRAKDAGGLGSYHFYSAQMNASGQQRLEMESGLRHALANGELFLVYQPKLDLRTRKVTGVEALMRWRHPKLGLISPAEFIPLAEETGLIEEFGRWALEVACSDARRWNDAGHAIQVSVNLSARQLNARQLPREVAEILAATRLPASQLELEITESGVMQDPRRAAAMLEEIQSLGVSLAIDDFGTGYSSLSYLQKFPFSTLKIDRSFMKDLNEGGGAAALTAGIIGLAHRLRMRVVAEGVETVEQLAYLRAHHCDEIQGFFLSRPIPAEELAAFLTRDLRNLVGPTAAA